MSITIIKQKGLNGMTNDPIQDAAQSAYDAAMAETNDPAMAENAASHAAFKAIRDDPEGYMAIYDDDSVMCEALEIASKCTNRVG